VRFTEAALNVGNQVIFLQVPDDSAVDYAFDRFTQTSLFSTYWRYTNKIIIIIINQVMKNMYNNGTIA